MLCTCVFVAFFFLPFFSFFFFLRLLMFRKKTEESASDIFLSSSSSSKVFFSLTKESALLIVVPKKIFRSERGSRKTRRRGLFERHRRGSFASFASSSSSFFPRRCFEGFLEGLPRVLEFSGDHHARPFGERSNRLKKSQTGISRLLFAFGPWSESQRRERTASC